VFDLRGEIDQLVGIGFQVVKVFIDRLLLEISD
jgi:hypothetical protein